MLSRLFWTTAGAHWCSRFKDGPDDHFTNQIKFWGIQPSYAFVAEPQIAERFNRTLKEFFYRNIADAVRERLPEPRSSSSGVARRDLNQARAAVRSIRST